MWLYYKGSGDVGWSREKSCHGSLGSNCSSSQVPVPFYESASSHKVVIHWTAVVFVSVVGVNCWNLHGPSCRKDAIYKMFTHFKDSFQESRFIFNLDYKFLRKRINKYLEINKKIWINQGTRRFLHFYFFQIKSLDKLLFLNSDLFFLTIKNPLFILYHSIY